MLARSLVYTVFSALASAATFDPETVYLQVKSDNADINNNYLTYLHEGAAINYAFLTSEFSTSSELELQKVPTVLVYYETGITQTFDVTGGYVRVTVEDQNNQYSFQGDALAINGTAEGIFYACKNTNDPYNYSQETYELMYYASDAPSDCIGLTLEKVTASNSSASASASGIASSSAPGSSSSFKALSTSTLPSSSVLESTLSSASISASSQASSIASTRISSSRDYSSTHTSQNQMSDSMSSNHTTMSSMHSSTATETQSVSSVSTNSKGMGHMNMPSTVGLLAGIIALLI